MRLWTLTKALENGLQYPVSSTLPPTLTLICMLPGKLKARALQLLLEEDEVDGRCKGGSAREKNDVGRGNNGVKSRRGCG